MRNFTRHASVRALVFSTGIFFFSGSLSVPGISLPGTFSGTVSAEEISELGCINPQNKLQDNSQNRGGQFAAWKDLDPTQRSLLQNFFGSGYADNRYTELTVKQDGKAATFLAVTNALRLTQVTLNGAENVSALDLVSELREIRADRLIVKLNLDMISRWRKAGGKYAMQLNKNQTEVSRVKFATHTLASGGLHCGYDLNWYTKANKTPHLHWNMRFSDGQADVHLDGYPAYLFGFIPNPFHLTYQNSDVRYWISKYLKKYGSAGFSVTRRN